MTSSFQGSSVCWSYSKATRRRFPPKWEVNSIFLTAAGGGADFAMDNGVPHCAADHIGDIVKDIEAGTASRDNRCRAGKIEPATSRHHGIFRG
jgi:hypothetical protein